VNVSTDAAAPAASLAQAQAIVARLYTDAGTLAAFQADPAGFAARCGPGAAKLLDGVDVGRLSRFARSLAAKRAQEARRLLPFTSRALGARFAEVFCARAGRVATSGPRRPLADAMAFARDLQHAPEVPREVRDAARFDGLQHAVAFRLVARGGDPVRCEARPRRGLWIRFSLFAYAFPSIDGCAPTPAAWPRRTTVVLFARVWRWGGVWYW